MTQVNHWKCYPLVLDLSFTANHPPTSKVMLWTWSHAPSLIPTPLVPSLPLTVSTCQRHHQYPCSKLHMTRSLSSLMCNIVAATYVKSRPQTPHSLTTTSYPLGSPAREFHPGFILQPLGTLYIPSTTHPAPSPSQPFAPCSTSQPSLSSLISTALHHHHL